MSSIIVSWIQERSNLESVTAHAKIIPSNSYLMLFLARGAKSPEPPHAKVAKEGMKVSKRYVRS
jgi:hypothetical protein